MQGKLSADSYTFGKEEGAALCFIQDLSKICGEATVTQRKKSEHREIAQTEAQQKSVAVREVKKANPRVKAAKEEVPREVPQLEIVHQPATYIQEAKQAQVPVAAPKQKRQISTAWTNEEHQILYDLIATGEVTNFELIQELLPSKTITNIKFKVGEIRRMYRDELKIQQEMASLMNIRAATTQRRRMAAGGGQNYAPMAV